MGIISSRIDEIGGAFVESSEVENLPLIASAVLYGLGVSLEQVACLVRGKVRITVKSWPHEGYHVISLKDLPQIIMHGTRIAPAFSRT